MKYTYESTLQYLYEKLPIFSRIGKAALKPGLDNTLKFCEAAGNPHLKLKCVHIAGTNGKGSVSHGLAAVLQQTGYKTGLYTSPHLVDFRERIRIDGEMISKEWVVDFVDKYKNEIESIQPSFFEITVVMAFAFFWQAGVDVAVIETGLGGRLDSTNVITPVLSIVTNISYDHKDLLGNTLADIAAEKAGIIKENIPTVIGEQNDETERVFFEHSVSKHSPLYYAQSYWDIAKTGQDIHYQYFKAIDLSNTSIYGLKTDLLGQYQRHNMKTILTACRLLESLGMNVSLNTAIKALSSVKKLTGLQGRWDVLRESPLVICDVAHNPAGLKEVLEQWEHVSATAKHIILGFVRDKDVTEALALFPKNAFYYFTNAQIPRALPADDLQCIASNCGLLGAAYPDVSKALIAAKANMREGDALLITGSFFIVGECMECFGEVF